MHTHTYTERGGKQHDGRAWPYTKKNPKPAPYTEMGLFDAEVVIKPGWRQCPACSAAPDVFSALLNQALSVLKYITAAAPAAPVQIWGELPSLLSPRRLSQPPVLLQPPYMVQTHISSL